MVQPGGVGVARVEHLTRHLRYDHRTQHVWGSLGAGGNPVGTVSVDVLLGSGSEVASTLEAVNGAVGQAAAAPIRDATEQGAAGGTGRAGTGGGR